MSGRTARRAPPVAVALAIVMGMAALAGQTVAGPERFEATAAGPVGGNYALQIVVDRWSTEAESTRLFRGLVDKGAATILPAIQDSPTVGYARSPGSGPGSDLRYARHTVLADGVEQVFLVTDRPINFHEDTSGASSDQLVTIIELKVNVDGQGEGRMSATAILVPGSEAEPIRVENWGRQPIVLTGVRRARET